MLPMQFFLFGIGVYIKQSRFSFRNSTSLLGSSSATKLGPISARRCMGGWCQNAGHARHCRGCLVGRKVSGNVPCQRRKPSPRRGRAPSAPERVSPGRAGARWMAVHALFSATSGLRPHRGREGQKAPATPMVKGWKRCMAERRHPAAAGVPHRAQQRCALEAQTHLEGRGCAGASGLKPPSCRARLCTAAAVRAWPTPCRDLQARASGMSGDVNKISSIQQATSSL